MKAKRNHTMAVAVIGISLVILIFALGTIWIGRSAKNDTDDAVRSVSLFYLNELAGRREQVVNNNLQGNIEVIHTAIELMTEDDLSDKAHLAAYQSRMKKLFKLDKFAFVDTEGLIYTSLGTESNIDAYHFDYRTLTGADISVLSREGAEKQVIIAVPVDLSMEGKHLSVCFMAINMSEMLAGISMDSQSSDSTFSNLYASVGSPLTSQVLGGLAEQGHSHGVPLGGVGDLAQRVDDLHKDGLIVAQMAVGVGDIHAQSLEGLRGGFAAALGAGHILGELGE